MEYPLQHNECEAIVVGTHGARLRFRYQCLTGGEWIDNPGCEEGYVFAGRLWASPDSLTAQAQKRRLIVEMI